MKKCAHCQSEVSENYCSSCGQRLIGIPLDRREIVSWSSEVGGFGRSFFMTLIDLFRRPNKVVNRYLAGDTKAYNSPVRFLFLILAILFLRQDHSDFKFEIYGTALFLAFIFFLFNLIFYRKLKKNWIEHALCVIFEASIFMLFILISDLIGCLIPFEEIESTDEVTSLSSDDWSVIIWVTGIFIYHLWFSVKVYEGRWFVKLCKAILSFLLTILLSALLLFQFA